MCGYDAVQRLLVVHQSAPEYQSRITANHGSIRFYDRAYSKKTHYLSNTYIHHEQGKRVPICIDGQDFPSVEHYFQYCKFVYALKDDAEPQLVQQAKQDILMAERGRDASVIGSPKGSHYKKLVDPNKWKKVSDCVMYRGVYEKFKQIKVLKKELLDTFPCVLIEHTPQGGDKFWGNAGDDSGLNLTGQVLGKVREQLYKEQTHHYSCV
ncbi:NADAR family protein [Sansalvadorimonas verongulae]|uniref:NADAR family protein n=1 Tax=Sansalvadorimonas verongulae TaxID=2172824 RepID=UPI002E30C6B4|nr:NADAR family protein [Sansalvadorimonas verongulae]MTI12914.1 NADAR family protein [Sansalvadorimonas verongulae]